MQSFVDTSKIRPFENRAHGLLTYDYPPTISYYTASQVLWYNLLIMALVASGALQYDVCQDASSIKLQHKISKDEYLYYTEAQMDTCI